MKSISKYFTRALWKGCCKKKKVKRETHTSCYLVLLHFLIHQLRNTREANSWAESSTSIFHDSLHVSWCSIFKDVLKTILRKNEISHSIFQTNLESPWFSNMSITVQETWMKVFQIVKSNVNSSKINLSKVVCCLLN